MKTRHCASTDGRPLITVPECDYRKLESALAEERRALARVTANYKKTVERYTEARADSERGDAFIADLNRTVAQLQADLEAEREKVKTLVEFIETHAGDYEDEARDFHRFVRPFKALAATADQKGEGE